MTFDNRLIFPPLNRPRRVLECGYGTAAWAIAVAEQYPRAEVRPTPSLALIRSRISVSLDMSQLFPHWR